VSTRTTLSSLSSTATRSPTPSRPHSTNTRPPSSWCLAMTSPTTHSHAAPRDQDRGRDRSTSSGPGGTEEKGVGRAAEIPPRTGLSKSPVTTPLTTRPPAH
jgi:hypothetical protein